MVLLLVAHDVNHLVYREVLIAKLGSADVLGDVDRGAVTAKEDLLVQTLRLKVGPNGAILVLLEESLLQTAQDLFAPHEVSVALVVDLVKGDAHTLVSLVKAFVDPLIHLSP